MNIEDLQKIARILAADLESLANNAFDLTADEQQDRDELKKISNSLYRISFIIGSME